MVRSLHSPVFTLQVISGQTLWSAQGKQPGRLMLNCIISAQKFFSLRFWPILKGEMFLKAVPYKTELRTHYFINFLRSQLSSSVCYFTFQVRFNPQFKQLFTRTKFRFSVWACCGHEIGARSQLLLSVFTANVNTIFENFHHSDPARVSAATQLWLHDTAESGETRLFLHKTQF